MIYEFIKVKRKDGAFEVPGEIIETYPERPYSENEFIALVKITSNDVEQDGDDNGTPVDLVDIDGVGENTAARMKAEGLATEEQIREATIEELTEVKGVGPGTAENIKEYIE